MKRCLDSLRKQSYFDHEVIVVDNGSTDGSIDLIRRDYPEVRLVCLHRNYGFARACNEGIRRSSGKVVALLNNDAEAEPDWLMQAVSALEERSDIAYVASKVLLQGRQHVVDACGDYYTAEGFAGKVGHLDSADEHNDRREVFGASASAAVYRRSLFEDIGPFDEDFFMVHEDSDLNFRANLMGYKCLFVPTAVVHHDISASLGRDSDQHIYLGQRNIELVFLKNMPMPLILKYMPLHILAVVLLFLLYLGRGRPLPYVRGKIAALRLIPNVLKKRQRIQQARSIPASELDAILTKGWMAGAIKRRMHAWAHPNRT